MTTFSEDKLRSLGYRARVAGKPRTRISGSPDVVAAWQGGWDAADRNGGIPAELLTVELAWIEEGAQ